MLTNIEELNTQIVLNIPWSDLPLFCRSSNMTKHFCNHNQPLQQKMAETKQRLIHTEITLYTNKMVWVVKKTLSFEFFIDLLLHYRVVDFKRQDVNVTVDTIEVGYDPMLTLYISFRLVNDHHHTRRMRQFSTRFSKFLYHLFFDNIV